LTNPTNFNYSTNQNKQKNNNNFFKYQSTPEKKIHYQPALEKISIFFNHQSNPRRREKKKHKFLQLPGENEWQKKEGLENQRFLTWIKNEIKLE
jgi:hypothetical protein